MRRVLIEHMLTIAEQRDALEKLTDHNRRYIFYTTAILGMRIGEAIHMTKRWFDPEGGYIRIPARQMCSMSCASCYRVRTSKTYQARGGRYDRKFQDTDGRPDGMWYPKTERAVRTITVASIQKSLNRLLFNDKLDLWEYLGWYFDTYQRVPDPPIMGRQNAWRIVKQIGEEIGRPDTYPHALRATAATNFARIGLDMQSLCDVMGWASLETANRYIRFVGAEVSRAFDRTLQSLPIDE